MANISKPTILNLIKKRNKELPKMNVKKIRMSLFCASRLYLIFKNRLYRIFVSVAMLLSESICRWESYLICLFSVVERILFCEEVLLKIKVKRFGNFRRDWYTTYHTIQHKCFRWFYWCFSMSTNDNKNFTRTCEKYISTRFNCKISICTVCG